ncbi:MAG TPA: glycosyltransferase [Candidatus Acidoferrum sp.]|nr:glycosyltransferase [Candidatus Acidoferrum sp.]
MAATEQSQLDLEKKVNPLGRKHLRIAFSSNFSRRHVTETYLSDTFPPGSAAIFDLDPYRANIGVLRLLEELRNRGEAPDIFAHLVHTPALPVNIHRCPIPTVSLDIDSFWWTESRIRWSLLFDYVFVWHKSFVPRYQAAGHPKVFAMPHAVDADAYQNCIPESERSLDVGWVGAFGYGHYARRRRIIGGLAARLMMNDPDKKYSKQETADIYSKSKIVVNVSRDEFPQEANMRCYEAMAAGALLITQMPSELTEWGFREGEHFIGWRSESEIPALVDKYIQDETQRLKITRGARELTMSAFTFQHCRDRMLAVLEEHPNQFFAPARNWPAEKVSLTYLEYYYRYLCYSEAFEEFAALRKADRKSYWKGLPMMLKTLRHFLAEFR